MLRKDADRSIAISVLKRATDDLEMALATLRKAHSSFVSDRHEDALAELTLAACAATDFVSRCVVAGDFIHRNWSHLPDPRLN